MKYEKVVHNQEMHLRRGASQVHLLFLVSARLNIDYMPLCITSTACSVNDVCPQDFREFERFLRESNGEALKEEERRFRFLAEKHNSLMQSVAQLMNRVHMLPFIPGESSIFDLGSLPKKSLWFAILGNIREGSFQ